MAFIVRRLGGSGGNNVAMGYVGIEGIVIV